MRWIPLFMFLIVLLLGCDCLVVDCPSSNTLSLLIRNENGDNLLSRTNGVYHPDSIKLRFADHSVLNPMSPQTSDIGFIVFQLDAIALPDTAFIVLHSTDEDTIVLSREVMSIECCSEVQTILVDEVNGIQQMPPLDGFISLLK